MYLKESAWISKWPYNLTFFWMIQYYVYHCERGTRVVCSLILSKAHHWSYRGAFWRQYTIILTVVVHAPILNRLRDYPSPLFQCCRSIQSAAEAYRGVCSTRFLLNFSAAVILHTFLHTQFSRVCFKKAKIWENR